MTDYAAWEANNAAYLSAALEWVRARLELHAPAAPPPPPAAAASRPSSKPGLFSRASSNPPASLPALPASTSPIVDSAFVERAAAELASFETSEPAPALIILARRFGLTAFEREVLILCISMELDTRIASLCARAHDDRERPYPTFALALSLSKVAAWDALSSERPLRRLRLIEMHQSQALTITASPLRVDERILSFVKGLNHFDERLAAYVSSVAPTALGDLSSAQQQASVQLIARLQERAALPAGAPVVRLIGNDRNAYVQLASAVAHELGLTLCRLSADMLPAQPAELETFIRLWQRESQLLPIALYIAASEAEPTQDASAGASSLTRLLRRLDGLVFLEASDSTAAVLEDRWEVEVERPTASEQANVWRANLGEGSENVAAKLAGQFNLNISEIRTLAARAQHACEPERSQRLWRSCVEQTRPLLSGLAQKLEVKATWDDIVLPKYELSLLRNIATQVGARTRVYDDWGFRARMNRGLGISALFAGDSGTGKTMAAEVLANALQLDLYRIDLSAVVSKYIGETEKNLRKLFNTAEQGGAILFFDEADALFGKRSEVKDAHDRYANIEINYLLQRMEAFSGLAILASNMKSALDPAFVRRLRFIVSFGYPAASERQQIWERVFPASLPLRPLDYPRLARLNLTGGNIHNIALNAAFLAAESGVDVSMPVVLDAVRMELRKLERPINESELSWDEPRGVCA